MIKDILIDIVAHTTSLGFPFAKIQGTKKETVIESIADQEKLVVKATTHNPIKELEGIFGLPNLSTLNHILKNPEYKENPHIEIVYLDKNGKSTPNSIFFENEDKDFNNSYKLMTTEVVNARLGSFQVNLPTFTIEFTPSINSVQRLKLQAQVHSDEDMFKSKLENQNLVVSFGGISSTHVGSFVFQSGIEGKLKNTFIWPLTEVINILSLDGDMTMKISDEGLMMITVDSGLATYDYIIPAITK